MMQRSGIVFIVDDDASVRRGVERLLRAAGYQVEAFASAAEFLRRREHDGPCCLVLDIRMPGMTGLELRDALLAAGRDLPIIFVTGHGDIPMAVQAMKAGAIDFLTKPFDQQVLLEGVGQALAKDAGRWAERGELIDIERLPSSG